MADTWYMAEMNRLFPRTESINPNLATQSPYSSVNRSSSSADSTSPESVPEFSFQPDNRQVPETLRPIYQRQETRQIQDTPKAPIAPFLGRCQRPIVGRKILPETSTPNERVHITPIRKIPDDDYLALMWQDDPILNQHTPPNVNYNFINNTNVFYELFPPENKGLDYTANTSPMKLSSNLSTISPTLSNVSPQMSPPNLPNPYQSSPVANRPGSSRYNGNKPNMGQKMCTFCKKNGETPIVYLTHSVKEKVGNKFIVSCPILRSHVCSTCGGTGDDAHTITYCPILRSVNNGQPLQSTTITLKNTRIKSNGRRRF